MVGWHQGRVIFERENPSVMNFLGYQCIFCIRLVKNMHLFLIRLNLFESCLIIFIIYIIWETNFYWNKSPAYLYFIVRCQVSKKLASHLRLPNITWIDLEICLNAKLSICGLRVLILIWLAKFILHSKCWFKI